MSGLAGDADEVPVTVGRAPHSYWVVAILTLIYTFNFVDRQIVSILAEPIKADLKLSDTQLGLLSGLTFALFYTTLGIPVAWLADRTNRVRIVGICCAVWSLFCAAGGLATNFTQLALARIGVGIGEAGGTPPSHSILSDCFPPSQRARALGIFSLGPAIGPFVGSALGGGVAALYGWRVAFVAVAVPGIVLALVLLIMVKEPVRGRFEGGAVAPPPPFGAAIAHFLGDPVLLLTAIATGMAGFVGFGMLVWSPAFLMRNHDMTLGEVAIYYSIVMGTVSAAGTVASGWLADLVGKRDPASYAIVPALAHLISIPFFLGALWAPSWAWAVALLAVPNFFTSMFLAPAIALVQNRAAPGERAISSSIVISVLNLVGLGGGPLLVGMVSDGTVARYGDDSLILGLAALAPFFLLTGMLYYAVAIALRRESGRSAVAAPAIS